MNPIASSMLPATESNSPSVATSLDSRVRSLVRKALQNSGYATLTNLECQFYDGVVVLRGTVPSYYLKQVAQESVRRLGLADRIDNRVTVSYQ